jgi:uncharacterized protein
MLRRMNFEAAKQFIVDKLQRDLSPLLTYHGLHHTMDVFETTAELCKMEHINGENSTLLLTAALFHDAGFLINNKEHELLGCQIVREHLPDFDYSAEQIETICGMIMATKIPQSPKNHLEQILCDADLDYLGREDFFRIGDTLYEELRSYHVLKDERSWNRLQVGFLESHTFFTATNLARRNPQKRQYLTQLKALVESYEE